MPFTVTLVVFFFFFFCMRTPRRTCVHFVGLAYMYAKNVCYKYQWHSYSCTHLPPPSDWQLQCPQQLHSCPFPDPRGTLSSSLFFSINLCTPPPWCLTRYTLKILAVKGIDQETFAIWLSQMFFWLRWLWSNAHVWSVETCQTTAMNVTTLQRLQQLCVERWVRLSKVCCRQR